ncbi:MAG: hypothetical protein HYZ28_20730 [Myxococcales bacterium]|nr:hypothetical protein [Myxococcales bacterium]
MRTTLTLEDDVAALLRGEMKRSRKSLKEIVNAALRRGLQGPGRAAPPRYRLVPHDGKRLLFPLDSVSEALRYAEGEEHR